ncbi:DinB family protein [Psychroflexus tropicus]|uniref:DinB family protein n=1 Tax=Psychroflexus tropicus TaxID=197345 RepID=UPI00036723F5|nr:DinB family protein [Psychroflexus tropicus]
MAILKSDITNEEYKSYYDLYLSRVISSTELFEALHQEQELVDLYECLPSQKHEFRYAEAKWTPKQILQHLIDTERIFVNRALRFAREDFTVLPGYDENDYAENCFSNKRTIDNLLQEFKAVRNSTILLYKSFDEQVLKNIGQASGGPFSVRVIPFILCGHQKHHIHIIKERYLKA